MTLTILDVQSGEHSILTSLFLEINHSIEIERFSKTFNMNVLPQIHIKLIKLLQILNKPKKDANQVINSLQTLYEASVRDFIKGERTIEQLFGNAVKLSDPGDEKFYRQARRLLTILISRNSIQNIPANIQARRRLAFFSNSLFMNMPHAPQLERMMAFSVLTPYYNEEVLYSKEQLVTENEDGISILYYLQTIYDDEWKNFIERMRREGMVKDEEIWTTKKEELRLWASYRGQTLSRTVRGMMYYSRALKLLTFLDSASEIDIKSAQELGSTTRASLSSFYLEKSPSQGLFFQGNEQHEVEIYRVKLPGPLKIGEDKPENQNHALIYTRGDSVQTIDMNQDSYFEEALKVRNLLEEYGVNYGIRKPTILGVREHVFMGSVSSLAWFMSAQETSFVTLGQRVLANPLKIRLHYGHPDIFDRFWFLARGGLSKASRVINISEDIFFWLQLYFARSTMMVILTVYAFLLGRLYLVLSGIEDAALADSHTNKALGAILNQQFIFQLGLFPALPMIMENSIEHGFLEAIWDLLTMQLQLSYVFYTFSMGTSTHFFGRTVFHGGAKYRATGRGFVVQHKSFSENYRLYSRSHFIKAIELDLILTIYASYSPLAKDTFVYIAMTVSSWFLVL
ncbi:Callose synthase 11 [Hibiscus syriacus]|uniref:Callose synthase 11 n=1 Tax=Hibiscus syriacus TaxID=106335 RepID=A0A6A2XQM7_HIBSY|nr:Callose synthase 11 [Hibiscus syriacus]